MSLTRQGANGSRILLALDGMSLETARIHASELNHMVAGGKANDLIETCGASALQGMDFAIRFLDPKINDISATVGNRVQKYAGFAEMVTIHACMSDHALKTAAVKAEMHAFGVIAVTVLTDINDAECISVFGGAPASQVEKFTLRAKKAGVHGIVCSPMETSLVRKIFPEAVIINPGVRSLGADDHDQKRVSTPFNAIKAGADFIVCGRQIFDNPTLEGRLAEIAHINKEVSDALSL